MGIKIRNDTQHDVLVLIFTYIPVPHPSLFYRKTLLISAGDRINSPLHKHVEKTLSKTNATRLFFAPIGGEIVATIGSMAHTVADSILDNLIHEIIEAAVDHVMEKMENADENLEKLQEKVVRDACAGSRPTFTTTMTKRKMKKGNRIDFDGAGMAWFD
ncbi:hypothetical protein SPRG_12204 [Saprolegnia parasitica CBS 223.65]|uniref:Uncharacterized protein n=1 Tax=Saprolegnia parasitica (strain CBS 223.65) TaxID=695850 RepID=A0A067C7K3_SAPPC|nr:hypothetical protein SPRG_12204 [Saprolegnia parasitica CBS 223.65]KDO22777.1 hypothetical protein SPRG_12204 [Saprolegnia parasitica CBS 223.65]|eukprot:XP_012206561.1 hypothetical protein SPRG_12204 [Saprolegnia parasitica CBS 223.65]